MKRTATFFLLLLLLTFTLLCIFFSFNDVIEFVWLKVEKIGALATAFALFAAMYQSYVAWLAADATSKANKLNLFQQKFNLVLEQHNTMLPSIIDFLHTYPIDSNKTITPSIINQVRGHEKLSPYMRILYHTLKSITIELPQNGNSDVSNSIEIKKRYTSLVRSFIPNDLLFLIAVNASTHDNRYFPAHNISQYKSFQDMLKDYDFFEHLIINEEGFAIKNKIQSISFSIYPACFAFFLNKHTSTCLDENTHLNELKMLFNDSNFFVCFIYNLKNKYITIPTYIKNKVSLAQLMLVYFEGFISQVTFNKLNFYIKEKANSELKNKIIKTLNQFNVLWYSNTFKDGKLGFFNIFEATDFLTSKINFEQTTETLLNYKATLGNELFLKIKALTCYCEYSTYYEEILKYNTNGIINGVNEIIDDLLFLKNNLDNLDNQEELAQIFFKKKKELETHFKKYMNIN